MEKPITMRDIAKIAGTSLSTVSKALNNSNEIPEVTREKIRRIAEQHGYTPNLIARSLRTDSTKVIGMIVPDSSNLYYARLLRGAQDILHQAGYSIVVANTEENADLEREQINAMISLRVSGIIATPVDERSYLSITTPLVFVSRCASQYKNNFSFVITDDYYGGFTAIDYLLTQGKREIYFLSGPKNISIATERCRGYIDAHIKHGVPYSEDRIIYDCLTMEDGYKAFEQIHAENPHAKGLFCSSDNLAIGVLAKARDLGLQIPRDVGIVGYDNIEILQYLDYPLTTVSQARYQIGSEGAEALLKKLNGHNIYTQISRTIMKPELVIRST